MKKKIIDVIDEARAELLGLSLRIHGEPELGFSEFKAAAWIVEFLRKYGFEVEEGIVGLPTAFRGERSFGDGGPVVAFIAEYDALPEIGHACGHNLIAMMSVGAALGLAAVMEDAGLSGTVLLLGSPAEEGAGGKINMLEGGAFDDVEYSLMIHPSNENLVNRTSTACGHYHVTFTGLSAHSSNPQNGINALTALIQTFNNIDRLKPLMPMTANINGIITKGGTASNIITDEAVGEFTIRSGTLRELSVTCAYVDRAIKAAEVLTGARAVIDREPSYAEMYANRGINAALSANMAELGVVMNEASNDGKYGSSDIGNVSMKMPSIHSYLDIGANAPAHHVDFTAASASDKAHDVAVLGAKGLAMTGFDIMSDSALRQRINKEFGDTVPIL